MKFKIKKIFSILTLSAVLLSVAFITYADWKEPQGPIPGSINLPAALNQGAKDQEKLGGLQLNAGGANVGLIIDGTKDNGFFGIGNRAPEEKLGITGHLGFSGLIFANGNSGEEDQVISRTPVKNGEPQMDWKDRWAFMSIQRIDVHSRSGCMQVFPKCPADWKEREIVTLSTECLNPPDSKNGPPLAYGGQIRICYKDF